MMGNKLSAKCRGRLGLDTWGTLLVAGCLLGSTVLSAQGSGESPLRSIPSSQIFTFLFLMIGPIKILGPYAKMTQAADAALARDLAVRATLISSVAVLLAAVIGESFLAKYAIPVPVLTLAGGLILFLVALQTVLHQFDPPSASTAAPVPATIGMAMAPLAFPTIVTPHGIAAVIVFVALSPDLAGKLTVGALALGIMAVNLVAMLAARRILQILGLALQILGSVLGIIQVALGLNVMLSSLKTIWG